MARPPKTLLELIRSNGFRLDRHRDILERERLPEEPPGWASPVVWKALRYAQGRVIEPKSLLRRPMTREERDWTRREYARLFSRAVRALHGGRLPWALGAD